MRFVHRCASAITRPSKHTPASQLETNIVFCINYTSIKNKMGSPSKLIFSNKVNILGKGSGVFSKTVFHASHIQCSSF